MDKKKITAFVIFGVVAVLIALIGIFGKNYWDIEKSYSNKYISFKSTEAFIEKELDGYDVYFENISSDVIVLGKKETKEELATLGYENITLEEYATAIFEGEEDVTSKLEQSDSKKFYYFTYTYTAGTDDIFYVGAMYETDDEFWIINFASELDKEKDYKDKFLKWADTVKFKK